MTGLESSTPSEPEHARIPGFFVQAVLGALRAERIDLAELGLPANRDLSQNDVATLALPSTEYVALLQRACVVTRNPALGLLIGQRITETNLHMLGPIIVASRSLRSAIDHISAVQTAMFGRVQWELVEAGDSAFYAPTVRWSSRVTADLILSLVFSCAQRFVGPVHASSLTVLMTDPEPEWSKLYRSVFEQQVEFAAPRPGLRMPRALLDIERPGTDPSLAATLCDIALDRFASAAGGDSWVARLEGALREHTQLVHIDFDTIAARWQLSARALRRRVELEGTRLLDVLNQLRFERARQQLDRQAGASIGVVAEALGYSDVSAFQRAFKRWSGMSPKQYRERSSARS